MTSPSAPSWYDVLGIEPDASTADIRAAWRAGIADLDPSQRRFRLLNQAAEVLLDPSRRATYDLEIGPDADAGAADHGAEEGADHGAGLVPDAVESAMAEAVVDAAAAGTSSGSRRPVPTWLLGLVAAVAVALVTVTATVWSKSDSAGAVASESQAAQAEQVAVRVIGTVLSYDYRHLDEDAAAASSYMSSAYAKTYAQTFALVKENAPSLKAVVAASVIDSGIVRTGPGRVEVLLFVNQSTTNKKTSTPVVYKNQVTVTMVREDGDWLVDNLDTGVR